MLYLFLCLCIFSLSSINSQKITKSNTIFHDSNKGNVLKNNLILHTVRLDLVAGTADIGHAEIENKTLFSELLGAKIPEAWPPPLNDINSMTWFTEYVEKQPHAVGWAAWYFLLRENRGQNFTAIGNGGFKGEPDKDGIVEIGYAVLEEYQGKGLATEGIARLVKWAFTHKQVTKIIAQTLPDLIPSIKVLKKNNFIYSGPGYEPGTILFQLHKPAHRK